MSYEGYLLRRPSNIRSPCDPEGHYLETISRKGRRVRKQRELIVMEAGFLIPDGPRVAETLSSTQGKGWSTMRTNKDFRATQTTINNQTVQEPYILAQSQLEPNQEPT